MFTAAVNFTAYKIQPLVIVLKVYNQRGKGESQLVTLLQESSSSADTAKIAMHDCIKFSISMMVHLDWYRLQLCVLLLLYVCM